MEAIWNLIINNFFGCLLVFIRVSGIFTFNPIFSRNNVPTRVKIAASMVLAVFMITSMGNTVGYTPESLIELVFVVFKELLIGLVFGLMINLMLTVLIFAGELMDNQTGLSMAKTMDPMTGVSMPVFANVYYYMFILYFFLTGGHLNYIKLFKLSYETLPVGYDFNLQSLNFDYFLVNYMGNVLELAVKMALPLIATELIVEFSIGVLMKAVPTIQVFVINIQLKILVGLFMIVALAGPMSDFIDDIFEIMWQNLFSSVKLIGS